MPRKTFSLESSLYPEKTIQQAIEDFGADFDISFSGWNLVIGGGSDTELTEIFGEFMNYILSLETSQL